MNILRINFYELYQRHLCRHSQFGLNLWHVLSVYGVYFSIYSLVAFLIRTLLPEFTPTELAEAYRTSTDRQLSRAMGRRAVNWRIQDSPTRTSGAAKRKRRRRTCCSQLVLAEVHAACKAVAGLRFGRSEATESERIQPVEPSDIAAVERCVSRQIWGMIQLQLVTGMRRGEVRSIRLTDIDRNRTY